MIHAEGLTKRFGNLTAVDQISLDIDEGEVFGFLGPNGAGKTTTVRMLAALISKTSGRAEVAGYEIGEEANELKIRQRIGVLPDNVGLYDSTSAYQNLEVLWATSPDGPRHPPEEHRTSAPDDGPLGEEGPAGIDLLQGDETKGRHRAGAGARPDPALPG